VSPAHSSLEGSGKNAGGGATRPAGRQYYQEEEGGMTPGGATFGGDVKGNKNKTKKELTSEERTSSEKNRTKGTIWGKEELQLTNCAGDEEREN